MAGLEAATIELRPLREALAEGDRLAWTAFAQAAEAADGLEAHPSLARCAGCGARWTDELGPHALVEARADGHHLVGLLCGPCGARDDIPAMLERILRATLPRGACVVERRVVHPHPAGHA